MRLPDLTQHVDHFRERTTQDALAEATAAYWRRRAATFRWVVEVADGERLERNLERAQACENAARVAEFCDPEELTAARVEEFARRYDMQRFTSVTGVAA